MYLFMFISIEFINKLLKLICLLINKLYCILFNLN